MTQRASPTLKECLHRGNLTIGSWLSFGFTPVCEMMARAGFEWLVIDMEHTAIDVSSQLQLIQIVELAGCTPLVRVGANDELLIKRALDAGAHGVLVPSVNSREEAEHAVAATYYPPRGARGAGLGRASGYGLGFDRYKEWADQQIVLMVQIESAAGVRNLSEILSVEGVDGFIVGPYDLSGSLGCPGNWSSPPVVEALERVQKVMAASTKPGGFHVVSSSHRELEQRIEEGYRFLAYGDDMVFLAEKLAEEGEYVADLRLRGGHI